MAKREAEGPHGTISIPVGIEEDAHVEQTEDAAQSPDAAAQEAPDAGGSDQDSGS